MSVDILGTSWDQCRSTIQYCFMSMETIGLVRTDSPGQPPRLPHSSWTMLVQENKHYVVMFCCLSSITGVCRPQHIDMTPVLWPVCAPLPAVPCHCVCTTASSSLSLCVHRCQLFVVTVCAPLPALRCHCVHCCQLFVVTVCTAASSSLSLCAHRCQLFLVTVCAPLPALPCHCVCTAASSSLSLCGCLYATCTSFAPPAVTSQWFYK